MMQYSSRTNQRGFSAVILIAIGVVVLGIVGFAGYMVFAKNKDAGKTSETAASASSQQASERAVKAQCDRLKDENLCKFLGNFSKLKQYRLIAKDGDTQSTMEIDGDNLHILSAGDGSYETIIIGNVSYMKGKDAWYKQVADDSDSSSPAGAVSESFSDLTRDLEEDKSTYIAKGKEVCGKLQCFRYEIKESEDELSKTYVWFDDKDYMARRVLTELPSGPSDVSFEYGNISVKAPSPVKELAAGQYLDPTSGEVVTVSGGGDSVPASQ